LVLEKNDKLDAAERVYREGISAQAEPVERLQKMFESFLSRARARTPATKDPLPLNKENAVPAVRNAPSGSPKKTLLVAAVDARQTQTPGAASAVSSDEYMSFEERRLHHYLNSGRLFSKALSTPATPAG